MKSSLVWSSILVSVAFLGIACGTSEEETESGEGQVNASARGADAGDAGKKAAQDGGAKRDAAPASTGVACRADEQTVFRCASRDQKIIAVCASKDLSPTTGYVQYRFGTSSNVELSLPTNAAREGFRGGTVAQTMMFSGGGGAYIRFTTGDEGLHSYVVYTAIGKGFDEEGVAVQEGDKLISVFKCEGLAESELGPDFFQSAGISEGPDMLDFDLPATP